MSVVAPSPPWEPFTEPWTATALRTGGLALAIGVAVGLSKGRLGLVPEVAAIALWFTLGGHVLEVAFRNHLRNYLSPRARVQAVARIIYWFAGGTLLYACAVMTRSMLDGRGARLALSWIGGAGLVVIELVVHLGLRAIGRPNFYDGRG